MYSITIDGLQNWHGTTNLFQSEEHVRARPHFDPASEEGIPPVAERAEILADPRLRNRPEPDHLVNQGKYYGATFSTLSAMDRRAPCGRRRRGSYPKKIPSSLSALAAESLPWTMLNVISRP